MKKEEERKKGAGWPEWATAHFLVFIAIEKVCHDRAL